MRFVLTPILVTSYLLLAGCATQMKVAEIDQKTGLLKSERGEISKATVVTAKNTSIARFGRLAFASGAGDFGIGQLKATGIFDEVLNYNQLQKLIVEKDLQEKVVSINEPIGLSRLAKAYKPFLWINMKRTTREGNQYFQLVATDPATLEELFLCETKLDFIWAGVNDQNARYPLFNAFIEWARKNP